MITAVLRLKTKEKPGARPLCAPSAGRLWVVLDNPEVDLTDLESVALTDRPDDLGSYESRSAVVTVRLDRLCALRLVGGPFKKHSLPPPIGSRSVSSFTNALDLLANLTQNDDAFDTLRHAIHILDSDIADGATSEQLRQLLSDYALADHFDRVSNPTRLTFERRDVLVRDLEARLRGSPLTFLVGGVSAGRTPLTAVLCNSGGTFRYLAEGEITPDLLETAVQVGDLYVKSSRRHPSELAVLLTALGLAAIKRVGVEAARKALSDANASESGEPMHAFATHLIHELRSLSATADPSQMIGLFLRFLDRLVEAAGVADTVTVLLPFENLEDEWGKKPYDTLWTGLRILGHDLKKQRDPESRVRLLIMARSVPFDAIGDAGLRALVLAMPPLTAAETKTRLSEYTHAAAVSDAVVGAVHRETGGIPVLVAALLHAIPRPEPAASLDLTAVEAGTARLRAEVQLVCAEQPVETQSGQVLLEFVREMRGELRPGDEPQYAVFAGRLAFLRDHLTKEPFYRLFRAGLLWFEPKGDSVWSSLQDGSMFQMMPPSRLAENILDALAMQPQQPVGVR